jgi:hypothetical protein
MDSSGRIHMYEDFPGPAPERGEAPKMRDSGIVTRWPMPEQCNARKVLSALEKLEGVTEEVRPSDSALLPLTPFDRGYVLGLREYMAWRKDHP